MTAEELNRFRRAGRFSPDKTRGEGRTGLHDGHDAAAREYRVGASGGRRVGKGFSLRREECREVARLYLLRSCFTNVSTHPPSRLKARGVCLWCRGGFIDSPLS